MNTIQSLAILCVSCIFIGCNKESEKEIQECEKNNTGNIQIEMGGNLGLDPVNIFINDEWIDSLRVYDLENNKEDFVEVTKSAGNYRIRVEELSRNGGDSIIQWDTTLNTCQLLKISFYKKR